MISYDQWQGDFTLEFTTVAPCRRAAAPRPSFWHMPRSHWPRPDPEEKSGDFMGIYWNVRGFFLGCFYGGLKMIKARKYRKLMWFNDFYWNVEPTISNNMIFGSENVALRTQLGMKTRGKMMNAISGFQTPRGSQGLGICVPLVTLNAAIQNGNLIVQKHSKRLQDMIGDLAGIHSLQTSGFSINGGTLKSSMRFYGWFFPQKDNPATGAPPWLWKPPFMV